MNLAFQHNAHPHGWIALMKDDRARRLMALFAKGRQPREWMPVRTSPGAVRSKAHSSGAPRLSMVSKKIRSHGEWVADNFSLLKQEDEWLL
jgi:hypothetical protein